MAALPVGSIFVKVREGDAGARDALYENSFTRLRLIAAGLTTPFMQAEWLWLRGFAVLFFRTIRSLVRIP